MKPLMSSADITDEGPCDPDVKACVELEFRQYIVRDYPIDDFVAQVWNFDASKLPRLPKGESYTLPGQLCSNYMEAKQYLKIRENGVIKLHEGAETRVCHIFEELFERVSQTLLTFWDKMDPVNATAIREKRFKGILKFSQESIVTGNYAKFKPDFGYITRGKEDDASEAIAWAALGFFAELKKRKRSNNSGIDKDLAIDLSHLGILVGVVS